MNTMSEKFLKQKANEIRSQVLKMSYEGIGAHISSCLSIIDIMVVLYYNCIRIKPKSKKDNKRDRFILSKGHAAATLYAILADKGFFDKSLLSSYGQENTLLGDHPEYGKIPGIELSTGSLGHGASVACGMAWAAKLNKYNSKIFALLSDGECQEGSVWEAALLAGHQKLDNLVFIIDYNKLQAFGRTKNVLNLDPLPQKWRSFGWTAIEIDGHNIKAIQKTLMPIPRSKNKPTVIIAHTIAGKGVSFMENRLKWHYLNLTKEQYKRALNQLQV